MIGFVTKLVKTITLQRVLIWTLAMIASLVSYTAFEHRDELFSTKSIAEQSAGNVVGSTFNVKAESKAKIEDFVNSDQDVIGLAVISADIRMNARTVVHYSADGENKSSDQIYAQSVVDHLPLFTKNDDNNYQIVKLINGEFYCTPYSSSIVPFLIPAFRKNVVAVCRASLPPYYGHFSGFITVFLRTDPDIEKQVRLKLQVEQLATEIYFRDVITTSHKNKL